MKPNKEIRVLDTGIVCIETTDSRGNTKVETYTLREYNRLLKRRVKQERNIINSILLFVFLAVIFILIIVANAYYTA